MFSIINWINQTINNNNNIENNNNAIEPRDNLTGRVYHVVIPLFIATAYFLNRTLQRANQHQERVIINPRDEIRAMRLRFHQDPRPLAAVIDDLGLVPQGKLIPTFLTEENPDVNFKERMRIFLKRLENQHFFEQGPLIEKIFEIFKDAENQPLLLDCIKHIVEVVPYSDYPEAGQIKDLLISHKYFEALTLDKDECTLRLLDLAKMKALKFILHKHPKSPFMLPDRPGFFLADIHMKAYKYFQEQLGLLFDIPYKKNYNIEKNTFSKEETEDVIKNLEKKYRYNLPIFSDSGKPLGETIFEHYLNKEYPTYHQKVLEFRGQLVSYATINAFKKSYADLIYQEGEDIKKSRELEYLFGDIKNAAET